MSPDIRLRLNCISRNMDLLTAAVKTTDNPHTLRETAQALNELQTLVLMALYKWDQELVQNVAYGFEPLGAARENV